MILIKIHSSEHTEILALCDSNLIGKKINNLTISKSFYEGEEFNKKDLKILKQAQNINALGKQSIDLLLKYKLISKEDIKYYDNIPHVQLFSL